jgi:hypothetical protein
MKHGLFARQNSHEVWVFNPASGDRLWRKHLSMLTGIKGEDDNQAKK